MEHEAGKVLHSYYYRVQEHVDVVVEIMRHADDVGLRITMTLQFSRSSKFFFQNGGRYLVRPCQPTLSTNFSQYLDGVSKHAVASSVMMYL